MAALRVARRGEPEYRAFEDLLAANLDALYRTALRLCRGRTEDAEDLIQESVLRAFAKRDTLRDSRSGRSWMFTTLVRTHLNRVRSEFRRHETLASECDDDLYDEALAAWNPPEAPDDRLDREAKDAEVRAAVDSLPPNLRAVLLLVDLEDFSHREAAAMLDVPEGTVASRLFRARNELRSALQAESKPVLTRRINEG